MTTWQSGRESQHLDAIIDGRKTIEGRLNKGKFAEYSVGDTISLRRDIRGSDGILRDGSPGQASVRIVAIRHYATFLSMILTEGVASVMPDMDDAHTAAAEYNKFYSAADQAQYGVLAIEVRVIRDQIAL